MIQHAQQKCLTDRTSVSVVRKWRVGKYWAENPVEFENISGILVVQST